jgi:2-oxoglutarate dehydrogenase E1 component
MFDEFGINAGYVEDLHTRWLESPQSVEEGWRRFFERPNGAAAAVVGPATGSSAPLATNGNGWVAPAPTIGNGALYREAVRESVIAATELQSRVAQLVNAYRVRGHLFARVDPLDSAPDAHPELELANFGLSEADLDKAFSTAGMSGLPERATLRQIVAHLTETYCSSIGVEFTHIEEPEPRLWLQERMESTRNHASLDRSELLRILTKLTEAEIFEQFIHKNYVGARRFSLEGA